MGYDVMAMDIDEEVVQDLSDTLGYVVCADCSDEPGSHRCRQCEHRCRFCRRSVGKPDADDTAFKGNGRQEDRRQSPGSRPWKMLQKIGADKIIYSEKEMGVRVAHNLISPGIVDYIEMKKQHHHPFHSCAAGVGEQESNRYRRQKKI